MRFCLHIFTLSCLLLKGGLLAFPRVPYHTLVLVEGSVGVSPTPFGLGAPFSPDAPVTFLFS